MTATPEDTFVGNSTLPLKPTMREIRCKKRIWRRENAVECGKLLLKCENDVLSSEYAARVHLRCPNCGEDYTLADPRFRVIT